MPVAALLLAGLGSSCSQAPEPEMAQASAPAEERSVPDEPMAAASEEQPAPDAAADQRPAPASDRPPAPAPGKVAPSTEPPAPASAGRLRDSADTVTVTRPAAEPEGRGSALWEAAVEARKERERARPPAAVITDENLHEFQGTELTFAGPRPSAVGAEGAEGGEETPADVAVDEERGEEYWRSRVLDLRTRLRAAVDEVDDLEAEVAALRRAFYAEDDPYVRDGRIKPAWDEARDQLEDARDGIGRLRRSLEQSLEEGRRAGAYPGWLREGIELEPRFEEKDRLEREDPGIDDPHEPRTIEPVEPPEESDEPPR